MLPTDKDESSTQSQEYDTNFKRWMKLQAPFILSALVPGVQHKRTINVEVVPSIMHTDTVFQVEYEDEPCILHIEFQKDYEQDLPARLLACNAWLHWEYQYPVITLVIYPFKMTTAVPPLVVNGGDEEILRFDYQTLQLFEMEAQPCVEQLQFWMYPFISTMRGVHADLMTQILTQLSEVYSNRYQLLLDSLDLMRFCLRGNKSLDMDEGAKSRVEEKITTAEQSWKENPANRRPFLDLLAWMKSLLVRNENLDEGERSKIVERFIPFEQLWQKRPSDEKMGEVYYKKEWEKDREKGIVEGREKGKVQTLQRTVVEFVQVRFPVLTELAQRQAQLCQNAELLDTVTDQLFAAADVGAAQRLLESLSGI